MRDPNETGELTADSRAARGTAEVVHMVDPSGNLCAVSLRHRPHDREKVVAEKLAAGWTLANELPEVDA